MAVELNYSALDRWLHRLAFAGPWAQLAIADMEKTLFGSVYAGFTGRRPIFVTSLPRAGTTLMLDVLNQFPSVASHTYRDMPFVMAPVAWSRLSASFRKPAELKERAHGDGMVVGYDSPEAFEEILWRAFWPGKYHDTSIDLWEAGDAQDEAREFFVDHMRKIVALRRPDRAADGRYISKNNGNVARLDVIPRLFPDATILVPFRQPLEHAQSLLHQHKRFLEMHRDEPFVRRYMGDIGHYEFGDLHRPIAFPGLAALTAGRTPLELDYWIAYWIAAFDHVLARRDRLVLASYDDCCLHAKDVVPRLVTRLGIPEDGALSGAIALFRDTPSSRGRTAAVDAALMDRATRLHASLVDAASNW